MISQEMVSRIASEVAALGLSEPTLSALRAAHSGIHFTYCLDDDIGCETPYVAGSGFNIYLVDGREHCLKLTDELDHATGLVLAEVISDE